MRELALHLLDLAENSVAAGADSINIRVEEDLPNDCLRLSVADDGRGMPPDLVARVTNPFVTSRTERKVGLGLPLLKAAAEACQGSLSLHSAPGLGTTVSAEFQRSHLDRMPLGDLAGTWLTLLIAQPHIHWRFEYCAGATAFIFDDQELKHELAGLPLTDPAVLRFMRPLLEEGVARVHRAAPDPELALPVGGH
jgi:hypothetical protein